MKVLKDLLIFIILPDCH